MTPPSLASSNFLGGVTSRLLVLLCLTLNSCAMTQTGGKPPVCNSKGEPCSEIGRRAFVASYGGSNS
jgi:hypothetical protein